MNVALFGECMLELQGEAFGTMRQGFGGDTLNTAVYLARLGQARGIRASYATGLGEDRYSDGLLQRWADEGVGTELVRRVPGRMPGLYAIEVDARGERSFSYWRDTSAAKAYFDAPETPLEARLPVLGALYFSGISLAILPAPARERLLDAAARLRAAGGRVIFDNNYRPRLWGHASEARDWFQQACRCADIALVTADDESLLHELRGPEAALAHCLALPCPEVVVKRGAEATLVRLAGGAPQPVPVVPVPRVVDTTAAGDSFAGGYLAARLAGAPAAEAAALGNRLAAIVVQHPGAIVPREVMQDVMAGSTG
ncbi:sugar kinase [Eleftheria terrae]|uniref:sugar kinase n=1 Tax=Eleftheria terrae TaxID=1597781 RepID=UPI00263A5560|nr:sugar kinase [Eleftheria terrae]WKB53803.1 sugar kinase [Eleftheria terrae]